MSNRRYDPQFKAEVISLALSSDIPRTQLAIDLGSGLINRDKK